MKDYNKALNYAFFLLKYRPRSRQEICDRLKKKEYSAQVIEEVLSYLEENRYINDEEFARVFLASSLSKGWGRKRVDYALKKFGVCESIRKSVTKDKQAFRERLKELIDRRIGRYKRGKNAYQKMLRFLAAKGFDYEDIARALEETGLGRFSE